MTRAASLTFLALAALAGAAAPPPRPGEMTDDRLDYLVLASDRPVLLRVHLRLNDKPYAATWGAAVDKLFDWYDRDKDGFLQPAEAARIPTSQQIEQMLQGGIGGGAAGAVPLAQLDLNKDGKVSRDELKAYYRRNNLPALRFTLQNNEATLAAQTNKAILSRLDMNRDGKLTEDEVAKLPELLKTLDENEDEVLVQSELTPPAVANYGFAVPLAADYRLAKAAPDQVMIPLGRDANLANVAQTMLRRYDRAKKGKVAAKDIGLSAPEFAALDANKDGTLDENELKAFLDREPDLRFRAHVGVPSRTNTLLTGFGRLTGAGGPNRLEALPGSLKTKRLSAEGVAFDLGDARFSMHTGEGNASFGRVRGISQFYLQQFDTLAGDKKYVERKQEAENRDNPFVFQIFAQADRDADGKLTRKELQDWFNVLSEWEACFVNLTVLDKGRSLFQLIDENGDGRLSVREMRSAWSRLKAASKDGKALAVEDLPRTVQIATSQGFFFSFRPVPAFVGAVPPPGPVVRRQAVPAWFAKMDRNNDGDISPREWLGTEEEFREMDADGDGLISAAEAIRFEERRRREAKR